MELDTRYFKILHNFQIAPFTRIESFLIVFYLDIYQRKNRKKNLEYLLYKINDNFFNNKWITRDEIIYILEVVTEIQTNPLYYFDRDIFFTVTFICWIKPIEIDVINKLQSILKNPIYTKITYSKNNRYLHFSLTGYPQSVTEFLSSKKKNTPEGQDIYF